MYYGCCYLNRDSYGIIFMRGLCKDGRLNEATDLYSMFWRISQKGSGGDVAVFKILLDALCDNGNVEEAVSLLGEVLRKGLKAPKRACKHLDLSQCYSGNTADIPTVKVLINEALTARWSSSTDSYKTMAVDLYFEGKIDGGDKVLSEMQDKGFRPS